MIFTQLILDMLSYLAGQIGNVSTDEMVREMQARGYSRGVRAGLKRLRREGFVAYHPPQRWSITYRGRRAWTVQTRLDEELGKEQRPRIYQSRGKTTPQT